MRNLFARLLLERMEDLFQHSGSQTWEPPARRCPRAHRGPLISQVRTVRLQIPESRPPASPTEGVEDLAHDSSFLARRLPEAASPPSTGRNRREWKPVSLPSLPPRLGPQVGVQRLGSAAHLKLEPSSGWPCPQPPPPRPEQGDRGRSINQTQEADVTLQRFDINVSRPRGPAPRPLLPQTQGFQPQPPPPWEKFRPPVPSSR